MDITKVICKKCKEKLELCVENFHKAKKTKSGFRGECKKCSAEYQRKYNKDNKDKIAKRDKKYNKKRVKSRKKYRKKYHKLSAKYSTFGHQLFADEVRETDNDILEVKCKQCKKWFKPTNLQVSNRKQAIDGNQKGENHFYCSQECKDNCEVFRIMPITIEKQDELNAGIYKIHKHEDYYTDTQLNIWSKQVRDRVNNKCEKCESKENLQAHHVNPKALFPEQALDPLNGVCLCKECHKEVHSETGQLKKCNVDKIKMNGKSLSEACLAQKDLTDFH